MDWSQIFNTADAGAESLFDTDRLTVTQTDDGVEFGDDETYIAPSIYLLDAEFDHENGTINGQLCSLRTAADLRWNLVPRALESVGTVEYDEDDGLFIYDDVPKPSYDSGSVISEASGAYVTADTIEVIPYE